MKKFYSKLVPPLIHGREPSENDASFQLANKYYGNNGQSNHCYPITEDPLWPAIKDKLGINCVADGGVMELMRGVRFVVLTNDAENTNVKACTASQYAMWAALRTAYPSLLSIFTPTKLQP